MADLGESRIKVSLDVTEAKRQIAELRKEIKQGEGKTLELKKRPSDVPRPGGTHPDISGEILDDPDGGDRLGKPNRLRQYLLERSKRVASGLFNRSIGRVQQSNVQGVFGNVGSLGESAGLSGVAKVAGTAGAVYAGLSAGSKLAPYTLEAAKQMLPEEIRDSSTLKGLESAFNDLKNIVNNLESRIAMYGKAAGQATEVWSVGMRATGQMPDWLYYYNQSYDIGVAESDLGKKFDHFKRMNMAEAMGKTMDEVFKTGAGK